MMRLALLVVALAAASALAEERGSLLEVGGDVTALLEEEVAEAAAPAKKAAAPAKAKAKPAKKTSGGSASKAEFAKAGKPIKKGTELDIAPNLNPSKSQKAQFRQHAMDATKAGRGDPSAINKLFQAAKHKGKYDPTMPTTYDVAMDDTDMVNKAHKAVQKSEMAALKAKQHLDLIAAEHEVWKAKWKTVDTSAVDVDACTPVPSCLKRNLECVDSYDDVNCIRARRGKQNLCKQSATIQKKCCATCAMSDKQLCDKERKILAGYGGDPKRLDPMHKTDPACAKFENVAAAHTTGNTKKEMKNLKNFQKAVAAKKGGHA